MSFTTNAEAKSANGPAVKRPPPYHRSFTGFGAEIDLTDQVQMAKWPACQLVLFATATGLCTVRGEDGQTATINVQANVPTNPIPGCFSAIVSFTGAGAHAFVSWASRGG